MSRHALAHAGALGPRARGCFKWALRCHRRGAAVSGGAAEGGLGGGGLGGGTGGGLLHCGAHVRLSCLAAGALVWVPSARHPVLSGSTARARRPREALLHLVRGTAAEAAAAQAAAQGPAAAAAAAGGGTSSSSFSSFPSSSSSLPRAGKNAAAQEDTGALPALASLKAVFVVEDAGRPSDGLGGGGVGIPGLGQCPGPVRFGRPYRFRHAASGAYLAARRCALARAG